MKLSPWSCLSSTEDHHFLFNIIRQQCQKSYGRKTIPVQFYIKCVHEVAKLVPLALPVLEFSAFSMRSERFEL